MSNFILDATYSKGYLDGEARQREKILKWIEEQIQKDDEVFYRSGAPRSLTTRRQVLHELWEKLHD